MKSEDKAPTRSRSKRKPAADLQNTDAAAGGISPAVSPTPNQNVGELESMLSVAVGVLMVIAALFPRSFKQFLFLTLGAGLLYRGTTSQCGLYQALGLDTAREPLLKQLNERFLSPRRGGE
jgi:uncharacterized membrane protein